VEMDDQICRVREVFRGAKIVLFKKVSLCRVCGKPIELLPDGYLDLQTHNEHCGRAVVELKPSLPRS
jgi:hypothetical protein